MKKAYHSVSIVPGSPACAAATAGSQRKILSAEAPRLPLPDCTMSQSCKCRFQKHDDRRGDDDDRRMLGGASVQTGWYRGLEKRKSRGRRSSDR